MSIISAVTVTIRTFTMAVMVSIEIISVIHKFHPFIKLLFCFLIIKNSAIIVPYTGLIDALFSLLIAFFQLFILVLVNMHLTFSSLSRQDHPDPRLDNSNSHRYQKDRTAEDHSHSHQNEADRQQDQQPHAGF